MASSALEAGFGPSATVDLLLTFAEISAALLGFAAIVSILRGDLTNWEPEGRFWVMVVLSASAFVLSILPIPFLLAGDDSGLAWRIGGLGHIAVAVVVTRVSFWGQRIQANLGIRTNNRLWFLYGLILYVGAGAGLTNMVVLSEPLLWLHVLGLVTIQINIVIFFLRLLQLWLVEELDYAERDAVRGGNGDTNTEPAAQPAAERRGDE